MADEIVVFVPGIMGSQLEVPGGQVIWPGNVAELLLPYQHMDELMRPDLQPVDIIRKVAISEQYQGLVNFLEGCGFHEHASPPSLYVFPYDWRKSNSLAAGGLAALLGKVLEEHSSAGARITLIGHSMGGLVCRYFLESGQFSDGPAWKAVHRLVTLATPHRGAPLALTAAMGQEKRLFLSAEQVHRLCSDDRYPSLYELLPPLGEPFLWNQDRAYLAIDPDDPSIAGPLELSRTLLGAARDFHRGLDLGRKPEHVRYFFFVGTRQRTSTAVVLGADSAKPGKYLFKKLEADDGGDGTVPSWSATLTSVQSQPVVGEHSTIYRSRELCLTLSGLLGAKRLLAERVAGAEVAVRDRVVHPSAEVHVVLLFAAARGDIDGNLKMTPEGGPGQETVYPVHYAGPAAESLSLTLDAPAATGMYRVSFEEDSTEMGHDELFVQAAA